MLSKSSKAQTSFEMVMVAGLILIVILGALRLVPSIGASTTRMGIVKSEAMKILDRYDRFWYLIEVKEPVVAADPDEITIVVGNVDIADPKWNAAARELEAINLKLVETRLYSDPGDVKIIVEEKDW